jgi:hypothetical protein
MYLCNFQTNLGLSRAGHAMYDEAVLVIVSTSVDQALFYGSQAMLSANKVAPGLMTNREPPLKIGRLLAVPTADGPW